MQHGVINASMLRKCTTSFHII